MARRRRTLHIVAVAALIALAWLVRWSGAAWPFAGSTPVQTQPAADFLMVAAAVVAGLPIAFRALQG
ncbi:MAG: hypothetical protein M1602_04465, partial [Firmicutes bacterium]|nr:hypothetical protein [Bacillota bacterium]